MEKWMKFDKKELTFEFDILKIKKAGTYTVLINLYDQKGAENQQKLKVKV